jgi:hypothetical protein
MQAKLDADLLAFRHNFAVTIANSQITLPTGRGFTRTGGGQLAILKLVLEKKGKPCLKITDA